MLLMQNHELSHLRLYLTDLDECNLPGGSPCSQVCSNFLGGYNCSCNSGYLLDQALHNCTDVDECEQAGNGCHSAAICNNTAGSFVCYCPEGYTDVNGDGTSCSGKAEVWFLGLFGDMIYPLHWFNWLGY